MVSIVYGHGGSSEKEQSEKLLFYSKILKSHVSGGKLCVLYIIFCKTVSKVKRLPMLIVYGKICTAKNPSFKQTRPPSGGQSENIVQFCLEKNKRKRRSLKWTKRMIDSTIHHWTRQQMFNLTFQVFKVSTLFLFFSLFLHLSDWLWAESNRISSCQPSTNSDKKFLFIPK